MSRRPLRWYRWSSPGLSAGIARADVIYSTLNAAPPVQGVTTSTRRRAVQSAALPRWRAVVVRTPKANPGSWSAPRTVRYDAYHFTATETTCLTFRLRRISASGIIHMALHSSIDPADASVGWLADSGTSVIATNESRGFSVNVVAGETYILLLYHTNPSEEDGQYEASFEEPFTGVHESVLDAAAPFPSLRYTQERTGTFSADRLLRNGVQSSCGTARTFPGVTGSAGPLRYDAYEFVSPVTGCVTVAFQLTAAVGNVQVAAYSTFNPGDLSSGWLADAGASTGTAPGAVQSFSMDVTAGQVFTLVAFNVNASEEGAGYRLTVDLPMQPPTLLAPPP